MSQVPGMNQKSGFCFSFVFLFMLPLHWLLSDCTLCSLVWPREKLILLTWQRMWVCHKTPSRINFLKSWKRLFIKHSQFPLFRVGSKCHLPPAHYPGETSNLLFWNHWISLSAPLQYHHSIAMETNNMPQLSGNALNTVRLTVVLTEITGLPLQVVYFVIVIALAWNPDYCLP